MIDKPLIHRLLREGHTLHHTAAIAGCSRSTVLIEKRRLGLTAPAKPPLTDSDKHRMKQMLEDGASYKEVARTIGCRDMTVAKWFPGYAWTKQQVGTHSMTARRFRL